MISIMYSVYKSKNNRIPKCEHSLFRNRIIQSVMHFFLHVKYIVLYTTKPLQNKETFFQT